MRQSTSECACLLPVLSPVSCFRSWLSLRRECGRAERPWISTVQVSELPLPPTAPSTAIGSCSLAVNPHDTGCIGAADTDVQEGPSYMWDGRDVLLNINF